MQVTVPQFIDVENKIIGPISARQFIILVVAGFCEYLLFSFTSTLTLFIVGPFLLGLGILFAFVRINGQMFHIFALNVLTSLKRPRLRLWQRQIDHVVDPKKGKIETPFSPKASPSKSRLRELSLIVDTGGAYAIDNESPPPSSSKHPQSHV